MRQEDRLGRVLSQLEQQRIAFDAERKSIETQLRVLADQLGYERRRGIAQLIIMLLLILLGAASRSRTINAILTPLVTEARRRQTDYYHRKNRSGPLAGLHIDMGAGRPPAVIGQARPKSPRSPRPPSAQTQTPTHRHVQSSTPTPRLKTSLSRIGSAHTSLKRRGVVPQVSIPIPSYRPPVSSSEFTSPQPPAPHPASLASSSPPLANVWTPGTAASATRKVAAQSAHLHTMETGDRSRPINQDVGPNPNTHSKKTAAAATPTITSLLVDLENGGINTKRRRRLRSVLNSVDPTRRKDAYNEEEEGEKAVAGDTSQGEWGTDDFDTEASSASASASASEVEDQVRDDTDTKEEEMDGDTERRVQEKM